MSGEGRGFEDREVGCFCPPHRRSSFRLSTKVLHALCHLVLLTPRLSPRQAERDSPGHRRQTTPTSGKGSPSPLSALRRWGGTAFLLHSRQPSLPCRSSARDSSSLTDRKYGSRQFLPKRRKEDPGVLDSPGSSTHKPQTRCA